MKFIDEVLLKVKTYFPETKLIEPRVGAGWRLNIYYNGHYFIYRLDKYNYLEINNENRVDIIDLIASDVRESVEQRYSMIGKEL
ncbi:MAG TPA: hypothetical protein ENI26_02180 [Methylophaga aminisulfidivorans]|uniref:Uncharacterized protein n=2 Tax=root TaxID=1 RepID=A0A7C1VP45_9GAMM|nr:hypothetical protein [Methylophaga aminisulfidivorans]